MRNLGAAVNSDVADGLPNISADGLTLYFSGSPKEMSTVVLSFFFGFAQCSDHDPSQHAAEY